MGGNKEGRAWLLSVAPTDRTRGNGHKLKDTKVHLNTRKHFFIVRVIKHQNRLPKKAGKPLFLEILKTQLDMALGIWLQLMVLGAGRGDQMILRYPFQLKLFCVLQVYQKPFIRYSFIKEISNTYIKERYAAACMTSYYLLQVKVQFTKNSRSAQLGLNYFFQPYKRTKKTTAKVIK